MLDNDPVHRSDSASGKVPTLQVMQAIGSAQAPTVPEPCICVKRTVSAKPRQNSSAKPAINADIEARPRGRDAPAQRWSFDRSDHESHWMAAAFRAWIFRRRGAQEAAGSISHRRRSAANASIASHPAKPQRASGGR